MLISCFDRLGFALGNFEMVSEKVKVSTSSMTGVGTKVLGETVAILDLGFVLGKMADATKGKGIRVHVCRN
jgi:hypothetical protein